MEMLCDPTLAAFSAEYKKEDEEGRLHKKAATIRANRAQIGSMVTWEPTGAAIQEHWEVVVERKFRGYEARCVREALSLQRLTHTSTHGVPEIVVPGISKPGEHTNMYLFRHPGEAALPKDDEGMDITIKSSLRYVSLSELLDAKSNLWPEHAAHVMRKRSGADDTIAGAMKAVHKSDIPTLFEFAKAFQDKKSLEALKSKKDKTTPRKRLEGAASAEFLVERPTIAATTSKPEESKDLHVDLTDQLEEDHAGAFTTPRRKRRLDGDGSTVGDGEEECSVSSEDEEQHSGLVE